MGWSCAVGYTGRTSLWGEIWIVTLILKYVLAIKLVGNLENRLQIVLDL